MIDRTDRAGGLNTTPAPATTRYVGRFAPSPTGPLHFGSLVAALASFLDARAHNGRWLVRMEDVDLPRTVAGAADAILECLRGHGLEPDGDVVYQSERHEHYRATAQRLVADGYAFYCTCSRADLTPFGHRYPGTCRQCRQQPDAPHTIRLKVGSEPVRFVDAIQGRFSQRLDETVGDFVIWRKEGFASYQLAVVVDDAMQGITHVVRGADLLDNTPRQIGLQRCLGLPKLRYSHVPVIANAAGQKLSKQTFARALDTTTAAANLRAALRFLGQPQTREHQLPQLLAHAVEAWDSTAIPKRTIIPADQLTVDCQAFAT